MTTGEAGHHCCEIEECEAQHAPASVRLPDRKGGSFWICDECLERIFQKVTAEEAKPTIQ